MIELFPMHVEEELRRWVEAMCAPACAGREAGSPGGAAARAVIVEALRGLGLDPRLQAVPGPEGANVIARAPGRQRPDLARSRSPWHGSGAVLVGAHYDHLGVIGGDTYWGADDNAAAVAMLLELARALSVAPADADVLLVAFDAEEPPHFMSGTMGSMAFALAPPVPLAEIRLAVILDLVGHAVGPEHAPAEVRDTVFALGAEKSQGTPERVARAAAAWAGSLEVRPLGIDLIPPLSDYEAFRRAGVPFLFLTAGRWRHYHQPSDTPDKLDYRKMGALLGFVEALVRDAATAPRPTYDDAARDGATTVATMLGMARLLHAELPTMLLEQIAARTPPGGPLARGDFGTVLEIMALLEQGLA
jgi:peptidase M28-like protein